MNRMFQVLMSFVVIACVILIGVIVLLDAQYASAATSVTVCHATGSSGNPYVAINVSIHSVDDATGLNGHGDHVDDAWLSFIFEGITYPGQNEGLFGTIIDTNCNLIQQSTDTPTATNTPLPPTPTNTDVPPTNTSTPTLDPGTPTFTPTGTLLPTSTNTPDPTGTNTPTPTPQSPTNTPFPPKPAVAISTGEYPGQLIGSITIGSETSFYVYQGVNAEDGSLLLPDKIKGSALYLNTAWIHRLWKSGWLEMNIGNSVTYTKLDGTTKQYIIEKVSYIGYGFYPKINQNDDELQYIATCYSEKGEWVGVQIYKLVPTK